MIIKEFTEPVPGYQNLEDEETTSYAKRRTRLTLKQINKLRKMNDIRKFEKKEKIGQIRNQYGPSAESGTGGGENELF